MLRRTLGGERVHLVVRGRIELGRRVVGQAAEIYDGGDVVEDAGVHDAHVTDDQLDAITHGLQTVVAVNQAIEDLHRIAALQELFDQDGADVAGATDDEHLLHWTPHASKRAEPVAARYVTLRQASFAGCGVNAHIWGGVSGGAGRLRGRRLASQCPSC